MALSLAAGIAPNGADAASCGFALAFTQSDEGGAKSVKVYEATADKAGSQRPFAFVVPHVKVNTDGTRISYKSDDPRGQNGAINDIRNAFRNHKRPISDFEAIRDAGWKPIDKVWQVLSPNIIEKDNRPGKVGMPCMDENGYLVSMTADTAVNGGFNRVGDCDQKKWIDALTVPALVLPGGSPFQKDGAGKRSAVVAMTVGEGQQVALGMVGDTGPGDEIGEASVEMNRILNGLPPGTIPNSRADAKARFQAGRTVFLVFPGDDNRVPRPINAETVKAFTESRFKAWGGKDRLTGCLSELQ
ncbi:hypothetical protein [Ensifer sp.]|jgi:hypothetical protein|uniref:hypothetical protein n=1 Tax=Ensifer sp. TaxID=1872086 RepID=UPI002E0F5550|nr:hypothetical protein [Ensifer sp.]